MTPSEEGMPEEVPESCTERWEEPAYPFLLLLLRQAVPHAAQAALTGIRATDL